MARPKNADGIRAKVRMRDGFILVHFEEYPGHWLVTPEHDRKKAIAWAKRNRERLISRKTQPLSFYCKGFFDPGSPWVTRMKKKGHRYTEKYLINRRGYVENRVPPATRGAIGPGSHSRVMVQLSPRQRGAFCFTAYGPPPGDHVLSHR